MKKKLQLLGLSVFAGCLSLMAQTTHNIDWSTQVGANASLTINVGDEIVWTVTDQLTHNVVSSDPAAPTGFGSADLTNGQTYSFTFTSAGVFDYECSYHVATMAGTITVEGTASIDEQELVGFNIYPNPASDIINLNAQENIESVTIYNMMSQEVMNHISSEKMNSLELNISNLENGTYFLKIKSGNRVGVRKLIKR